MTLTLWNLAGFVFGMATGVLLLAGYQRIVYPQLSARHELAKVTGTRTLDPKSLTFPVRTFTLIIVPLLGLVLGHALSG